MPPLSTFSGRKFHMRPATGKHDRVNWSVLQRGITKANSHRAAEPLVYELQQNNANTHIKGGALCDQFYRANTKHWPFFCAPSNKVHLHTTSPHCKQHYPATSNETSQMTTTRGHSTPGWAKPMHWNSSWAHMDNQIAFLPGARRQSSWLPSA